MIHVYTKFHVLCTVITSKHEVKYIFHMATMFYKMKD